MEKLGKKKLDMQKLLAPAALVILYIVFSIFGNNFLSLDMVKNILESSYYIGFMAFGVTFIIITGGIDLSHQGLPGRRVLAHRLLHHRGAHPAQDEIRPLRLRHRLQ